MATAKKTKKATTPLFEDQVTQALAGLTEEAYRIQDDVKALRDNLTQEITQAKQEIQDLWLEDAGDEEQINCLDASITTLENEISEVRGRVETFFNGQTQVMADIATMKLMVVNDLALLKKRATLFFAGSVLVVLGAAVGLFL